MALHQTGKTADAAEEYKRAIQIEPNNADMHNFLGVALVQLGKIDKAIEHFKKALELSPQYEAAQINLRSALNIQNQKNSEHVDPNF